MEAMLGTVVRCLDHQALSWTNIIPWSSPVPSFGDVSKSMVATLGINPSNREFVDMSGKELDGDARRFHTLTSLGLSRWKDANAEHLRLIIESCRMYFYRNPYDRWFKRLDWIISGTQSSYYHVGNKACHLDLIPYATACKWTELTRQQRLALLAAAGNTLGLLLRDSPVRLLVLNGKSVVEQFQAISGIDLEKRAMPNWSLPRNSQSEVVGYSYKGVVLELSGIPLDRRMLVLGFNHNIQSSFGITTKVTSAIQEWIGQAAEEVLGEL